MKLKIAYLYEKELNLYGDTGNVEILAKRAKMRGIPSEILKLGIEDKVTPTLVQDVNVVFMGGGPDASQKEMYTDLLSDKKSFLEDYVHSGGVALFICGSYQLMGKYYKSADETMLKGLGIFDMYTEHFGHSKKRCVGNIVSYFENTPLIGFENHGGRTYIADKSNAFGKVIIGDGNNGEDETEGYRLNNAFGSYLHGPILSKNAFFADYLLKLSLKIDTLSEVDDYIVNQARTALLKRFNVKA